MPEKSQTLEQVRAELVRLLEADEWGLTDSADTQGRKILADKHQFPSQCEIIRFIMELLKKGVPLHEVELGEPPGSLGVGYAMNNADGKGLYVKVAIQDRKVRVLSFHKSKHYRGNNNGG